MDRVRHSLFYIGGLITKMIKWIFWDNDGVLVDTEELYFRSNREMLSTVGIDLTRERFVQVSLKEGRSTLDLALEKGIDSERVARLRDERNTYYSGLLRRGVRVIDGVRETLRRLHGNVSMGVVTSCREAHFDIIHSVTGLLPFFEFVITPEDVDRTKPNPEPYLKALDKSGCRPEHCLVVEDSHRGLEAAKAAGIKCVVVPNGLTGEAVYAGAYRVLENVRLLAEEVLPLL